MKNIFNVAFLVIINLIISVAIPFAFEHYSWLSESESILFGVLIWILLTATESLYKINEDTETEKKSLVLWNIENEFDTRLSNIREAHRKILANRRDLPDLFQNFFDDRVSALEKLIIEAANSNELHLERSHVVSFSVLLGSFKGSSDDIIRAVHLFEDNEWFFGSIARGYFYQIFELIKSKKIKSVKRLLLYNNDSELQDPRSIKIMKYHTFTNGYSYKAMNVDEFKSLVRDFRLDVARDFGIYGNKYMYMSEINRADSLAGYWKKDNAEIGTYVSFFDSCWNSPGAMTIKDIDSMPKTTMPLDSLFEVIP